MNLPLNSTFNPARRRTDTVPAWLDAKNVIQAVLCLIMVNVYITIRSSQESFLVSPPWREFNEIASPMVWEFIFGVTASMGISGMLSHCVRVQVPCLFVLSTMHGVIASCLLVGSINNHQWSTGAGTYFCVAILGYYALWRKMFT